MSTVIFRFRPRFNRLCLSACFREKSVWTSDKVVISASKDVDVPSLTVDQYLFRNLDKWAKKTAVICGHTNRQYTYEEVYKKSRILAANLRRKFKIKDGDTVAVLLPNAPEYPIITFGILAAGGVVTTMNPVYTAYEIQRQILLSSTTLIITNEDLVSTVKEALKLAEKDFPIISLNDKSTPEGTVSFKELVEDNNVDISVLKEVNRRDDDVAFLPYSSGTTGLPKGVQLTNRNIVANCEQQNTDFRQYEYTTVMFLGAYPQVTAKHLEHVTAVTSGAAPLPSADIQRLFEKAQREIQFCQGYGLTETSPLVSLTPFGEKVYEDVGYSLPNMHCRIVDGEMNNLGPGEVGELLLKGPNVMKGYLKNPKANSEVFVDGDWLRTGDLAKINENGLITIADRLKELIKVDDVIRITP
ncbi:hypothetical protein HF086_017370 [Spodoptera exigua]|uniref:AMP-dependent synthetase/ligase domain-containing protein n=1 Tax=Spodoptera exigua TaxID=7107 RepID=A0A922S8J1_SPOEX|nr:hypothetical protein HF086_017370 [Spodoptera exigua]